ncbi:hypothetical protein WJX84_000737 [Apatococcus fuscideae]|uniref:FAD-binding PCMH-type domain-containing protein n=1 Tax=Apatococcus fuscideae TaxID=2026836 RepID=A0AAW1T950_9CHLO
MKRAAAELRRGCSLLSGSEVARGPFQLSPVPSQAYQQSRYGLATAAGETASQIAAQLKKPDPRFLGIAGSIFIGASAALIISVSNSFRREPEPVIQQQHEPHPDEFENENHLVNWSETHECRPKRFYQPETHEELETLVAEAHAKGEKLRCVGSAISPNGLAMSNEGIVSLSLMDKLIAVDSRTGLVTVQAGARVQEVADAIKSYGLTLANYASVREQTIGGFTQVAAHGTGCHLSTVDDQVIAMRLITPSKGTLTLSKDHNVELFHMARVGLGCLGVVSEVTLQCVPAHHLLEHTYVTTHKEVRRRHARLLKDKKHLKYMWIPYTDKVVVTTCNPIRPGRQAPKPRELYTLQEQKAPLLDLLVKAEPTRIPAQRSELEAQSGAYLRDLLLAINPLDKDWVVKVNTAEAEFWRRSEGYRIGWSDDILGFDCGGKQWVLEVSFPTGTLRNNSGADLAYIEELLDMIQANNIPAPAPLEQRWTAASASDMSPASAPDRPDTIFSWLGIIMYMPRDGQVAAVTNKFRDYAQKCEKLLLKKYGAIEHWAKMEVPDRNFAELRALRERVNARYPVARFNAARRELDPKNIMSNHITDAIFK